MPGGKAADAWHQHEAGTQETELLGVVSCIRLDHPNDIMAGHVTPHNSTWQIGLWHLSTMVDPQPQVPNSGKISCGCHAVPYPFGRDTSLDCGLELAGAQLATRNPHLSLNLGVWRRIHISCN